MFDLPFGLQTLYSSTTGLSSVILILWQHLLIKTASQEFSQDTWRTDVFKRQNLKRERDIQGKCWGGFIQPSSPWHWTHSSFSEMYLLPVWAMCRAFIFINISLHRNVLLAKWSRAQMDVNYSQWRMENVLLYYNVQTQIFSFKHGIYPREEELKC